MAKGKQSKSKGYISKGEVGVQSKLLKSIRQSRDMLDNYFNAMQSWKRGSKPAKILQKSLNIPADFPYNKWNKGMAIK